MSEPFTDRLPRRPYDRLWASRAEEAALIYATAALVALLLSTQLMAQPFVWKYFSAEAIADAWVRLLRNRLAVALCIATAIVAVRLVPTPSLPIATARLAAAIFVGAVTSEFVLLEFGFEHAADGVHSLLPRAIRWCVIASTVAAMLLLQARARRARSAAQAATLRAAQIERQATEARLLLLRAQIEPHFLFNTLATIRQLHRSEPENGVLMLSNFIEYLKAALPQARASVTTLRDELELVRAYLGLIQVRMSGRLTSSIVGDAALDDHPFPPLSLATLVENAIKHGIVPSDDGGHVSITVRVVDGQLEASVVDDGVGLSSHPGGSGIGLANARARLVSLHGSTASLSLQHHVPHGVRATIRVPWQPTGAA